MHTVENWLKQLMFCLYDVDFTITPHIYVSMYHRVHDDEKWFYICKVNAKFYLLPEEELPLSMWKTNYIYKHYVFMCSCMAMLVTYGQVWDGKIGLWPFTKNFLQFAIPLIVKEELLLSGLSMWQKMFIFNI